MKLSLLLICIAVLLVNVAYRVSALDEEEQEKSDSRTPQAAADASTSSSSEEDDDDDDEDDGAPEIPEGMARENMVKWSAPDLTEEESHSGRMPSNMKCDGCTAVNFQLSVLLNAFHETKYKKKGKKAPESEIIELVEKICDKKVYENYGLKTMDGKNRLSGPGLAAADEPGMMQGGGRWPHRLHMMCEEIVGEADEYVIYENIVEHGTEELFDFLCNNSENDVLNSCAGKQRDEL